MAFLLTHEELAAPGARQTLYLLHGIFGSARNWRPFAARLLERRPDLRVVLIDLRNHGNSRGAPPPHDLRACAADLVALAEARGEVPDIVCGHSFGGKVALVYAHEHPAGLSEVWSLDSPPGPTPPADRVVPSDAGRVLAAARQIPLPVNPRSAASKALLAAGIPRAVATWMATNLRPAEGGYVWSFDVAGAEQMLEDYWRVDGFELIASIPETVAIHVVQAAVSDRWNEDDLARLWRLKERGRIRLSVIERAGHWVQVDNPHGLLAALVSGGR